MDGTWPSASIAEKSFRMTRTFDAEPHLVFQLWTDPRYISLWWGIEGATNPLCELDVRPGGKWRIDMRTPDGQTYTSQGEYLEVVEDQLLVFTDIPDETAMRGAQPAINTVRFEPDGQRTRVTLEARFASNADRDRRLELGVRQGIEQALDRLAELIARLRPA
jgi:uncharacterized protein YndB with AHSA1/START domain